MQSIVVLSAIYAEGRIQSHCIECHYAECWYAECRDFLIMFEALKAYDIFSGH